MAQITFSDENQAGDIPTFEISKEELQSEYVNKLSDMLDLREGKVVVCFQSWKNNKYENQHPSFLISNDDIDIENFIETQIKNITNEDIDFNFFCFDTYEDAFKYSIYLKEGL